MKAPTQAGAALIAPSTGSLDGRDSAPTRVENFRFRWPELLASGDFLRPQPLHHVTTLIQNAGLHDVPRHFSPGQTCPWSGAKGASLQTDLLKISQVVLSRLW